MNTFLAISHSNKDVIDLFELSDLVELLPSEPDRIVLEASDDGRLQVLTFESTNGLYGSGSSVHVEQDSLTVFAGHVWSLTANGNRYDSAAFQAHEAIRLRSIRDFRTSFSGQYALLHVDFKVSRIIAFCDEFGTQPFYYYQGVGKAIVSNRLDLIRALVISSECAVNPENVAYHATAGYMPPRRTPYKNINECTNDESIYVKNGIVFRNALCLRERDVDNVGTAGGTEINKMLDKALHEISENLGFLNYRPTIYPYLGLSGGKDSRLILAAALHAGVARKILYFTRGVPEHPDVVVAKELTREFELPHKVLSPPEGGAVNVGKLFLELMPKHMHLTEGTLNLFDLQVGHVCGGDPVLHGLNGENIRSVYDLPDHAGVSTKGSIDCESAIGVLDARAPFDLTDAVNPDVLSLHRKRRVDWVKRRVKEGVEPSRIPTLYRTEFQSRRRNANISKVRAHWYPYISVLQSPSLKLLESVIGVNQLRAERVHFELMRRVDERLVKHRFAGQRWSRTLPGAESLPDGFYGNSPSVKKKIAKSDWKESLDYDQKYRKLVTDYIMQQKSGSEFWDICSRDSIERFLLKKRTGHMERFHFHGLLTCAMLNSRNVIQFKLRKQQENERRVFVRRRGVRGIYLACQGRLRHIPNMQTFRDLGGQEKEIWDVSENVFRRFVITE